MRAVYVGCGASEPDSPTRKLAERLADKIQSLGGVASGSWVTGVSLDREGLQRLKREMSEVNLAVAVVDAAEPLSLVEFGLLVGMGVPTLVVADDPGSGSVTELGPSDLADIEDAIRGYLEAAAIVAEAD